jgi:quinol monooxygenase YgiN
MLRRKSNSFGVIARIRGLPERADELRQRLLELVRLTRDENGCLSCEMIENSCDSTEFTLLEEWSQEEEHNSHFGTDLIQNEMKFFPGLLSGELDLSKHVLRLNSIRYGTNSYCLAVG